MFPSETSLDQNEDRDGDEDREEERGTETGEWGTETKERGTETKERGTGNRERFGPWTTFREEFTPEVEKKKKRGKRFSSLKTDFRFIRFSGIT